MDFINIGTLEGCFSPCETIKVLVVPELLSLGSEANISLEFNEKRSCGVMASANAPFYKMKPNYFPKSREPFAFYQQENCIPSGGPTGVATRGSSLAFPPASRRMGIFAHVCH